MYMGDSGCGLNTVDLDTVYPELKTVVLQVLSLSASIPVQVHVGNEVIVDNTICSMCWFVPLKSSAHSDVVVVSVLVQELQEFDGTVSWPLQVVIILSLCATQVHCHMCTSTPNKLASP